MPLLPPLTMPSLFWAPRWWFILHLAATLNARLRSCGWLTGTYQKEHRSDFNLVGVRFWTRIPLVPAPAPAPAPSSVRWRFPPVWIRQHAGLPVCIIRHPTKTKKQECRNGWERTLTITEKLPSFLYPKVEDLDILHTGGRLGRRLNSVGVASLV